ncbi:MAG: biopolymer transporter, partial [Deltaproteobacteria bacterium]|nr:biopolymer transporter [Deltaproteobacteria bacterium]
MGIGALLKSFIYLIASSLFYPVLFLLVVLTVWILIYGGSFFAEWLERVRLFKYQPEDLPKIIKEPDDRRIFSHRVNYYIENLRRILVNPGESIEVVVENILQEKTLSLWKSLDRARMVIRVGPSLG